MRVFPKFILLLLLLKAPSVAEGQILHRFADTLKTSLKADPKFFLGFDTRRSFISSRDVKIFGIRLGLDFAGRARFGFGFYGLSSPFVRNYIVDSDSTGQPPDTIKAHLGMGYISFFGEYVFLKTKRWELSVPIHVGLGNASFKGFEAQTLSGFILNEISFQSQYKIFPWIGLGAGIGYRYLIFKDKKIGEDLNSPVYMFKIKIFLGPIVNAIFKKKAAEE